jgi:hypothetical protein
MYLYLVVAALAVIGIIGGIATGGIFTIALIPIAVVVLVAGIAYRSMGHAAERGHGSGGTEPPLPHSAPDEPGHVPTSPEGLADARRAQQ